jgi:hypothetical protein
MPQDSPYVIVLTEAEAAELAARAGQYTSPYYRVMRARIVLLAAEGLSNTDIAAALGLDRQLVSKWRKRFFEQRLHGLEDEPRPGRPRVFPPSGGGAGESPRL